MPRKRKIINNIEEIVDYYLNVKSLKETSKKFNISQTNLWKNFKEKGIIMDKNNGKDKIRKYKLDENYFEKIDNRDKAYITGLLHADGFINLKNNQVRLKLTDLDLIKEISDKIFTNRKLYSDSSLKNKHKPNLSLVISSKKIMNDCIKHGCVHQKTFNLQFPSTISKEFMGDYLRGYFDGDGHISIIEKFSYKPANFKIVSTVNWINKAMEWLKNNNIQAKIYYDKRHDNRVAGLHITDNKSLIRFYNLIYRDVDKELYLKRKYETYKKFVEFKKQLNKEKYDKIY